MGYYLKHKYLFNVVPKECWLNYDKDFNYLYLSKNRYMFSEKKLQFLKKKFKTDFSDFQIIPSDESKGV